MIYSTHFRKVSRNGGSLVAKRYIRSTLGTLVCTSVLTSASNDNIKGIRALNLDARAKN